jgi:hypothetical protein
LASTLIQPLFAGLEKVLPVAQSRSSVELRAFESVFSTDVRRVTDQGARSGGPPDVNKGARRHTRPVARYLLQHRHQPRECGVAFASFKGHESPLRHQATVASCRSGGHAIWWTVEATSEEEALRLLPSYVAKRTTVTGVSEVEIP